MDALVYCTAFASTGGRLTGTSQIILQGRFSSSTSQVAAISIPGLTPSSDYNVYCMTISLQNVEMLLSDALDTRRVVSTSCCKAVLVSLMLSSMYPATTQLDGLSLALDAHPTASIDLSVRFVPSPLFNSRSLIPSTPCYSVPQSISISSTDSSALQRRFLPIIAVDEGLFDIRVSVEGPSAAEYSIVLLSNNSINVLGLRQCPPKPIVTGAVFSDDLTHVSVEFDSATDRGGLPTAFQCESLLSFPGSQYAQCSWSDDSTINIYPLFAAPNTDGLLQVGTAVTLLGGKLLSKCTYSHAADAYVEPTAEIIVQAPISPVLPVVSLLAPPVIGSCNSLLISTTNSVGAGGRPWLSYTFKVLTEYGASSAATELERYLRFNYSINPPSAVPYTAFQKGYTYSIQLTLCNFAFACGSAIRYVRVQSFDSIVPIVTVDGGGDSQFSMLPSAQLMLHSNAYTQSCDGSPSVNNLQLSWTIDQYVRGSYEPVGIASTSQRIAVFKLGPNKLQPNTQYVVTASATSLLSGISSSARVFVSVLQSPLVALLTGGSPQYLRVGRSLVVDASQTSQGSLGCRRDCPSDGLTSKSSRSISYPAALDSSMRAMLSRHPSCRC